MIGFTESIQQDVQRAVAPWRESRLKTDLTPEVGIMSLDKIDVVDAVGTEKVSGIVVLNLFDSWDWNDCAGPPDCLARQGECVFGLCRIGSNL
jgi:hypothetical protein